MRCSSLSRGGIFLLGTALFAQEGPWSGTFMIGISHWAGLGEVALPPSGFEVERLGNFRPMGGNLELGLYRHRVLGPGLELQGGGEFGVLWHESRTHTTFTDFAGRNRREGAPAANAGHLTGSLRLVWPRGRLTPFLGLGLGYYRLVFKEVFGDMTVDTSAHSEALGGFLTAGLDVRSGTAFAVRVDAQLHEVSFAGASLRGQRVSGPITTLRLGGVFRF